MGRLVPLACAVLACLALGIAGCGGSDDNGGSSGGGATTTQAAQSDVVAKAQKGLEQLKTSVLSTGPNGEKPSPASDLKLSDDELAKIKGKNATAAIVLHYGGNDWSTAQVDGLRDQLAKMGIRVIAVTDANFKPEKQVSDIETVLAKKPDIIISLPTDPVATASAYRKAERQGVKLVFMDNVPKGFTAGKDYVSVVSADNYGNGVASAHLMAETHQGKGKIGIVFHEADFFVTRQRYDAFKKTISEQYPDVQIVAEQGIGGPDFAGDAEKVASAMLTKNADLDAIWAVWDVPAEGVLAAARANGRSDLKITTIDLGQNVAIDMAKGGPIKGLGAQRPFDQGVAEATLAGYGLLGKEAPAYVAVNSLPVTPKDLASAWEAVYHQGLPPKVVKAEK
ncbi:MAG: ribose transport system substrate-binding protein [Solirubrobacteraceae bacterium]|nr:ribose transport system substrate-binding protein [Solirubrobacteraceae bacterium]